ncbi:DNA polymerase III subunit delta' [Brochothrix thermosphacta]|uniref:DNA polymerase III subunit delta' n=1 Tax=Brochothrix thermosphacta TaxID=2756 RepID=UPI000EA06A7B|nr:DNA polymerase III subunit delta' [Brochothrix thermosphacta]
MQAEYLKRQPVVMRILTQSITENRLGHAYIFEGARGIGKREVASWLTKAQFCMQASPENRVCSKCVNCRRIEESNHPDVHFVEPDGASIKTQQIKDLRQAFVKRGMESDKKIIIIDQAEKMTAKSANSLLKFIEEPEAEVLIVFLTTAVQRLLPTIQSRCQLLTFQPLATEVLVRELETQGISEARGRVVAHLTQSSSEAIEMAQDEWFVEARKHVVQLYGYLRVADPMALIYIQTDWIGHFKEKNNTQLGLDLLLALYEDKLHLQLVSEQPLICMQQEKMLKQDALNTKLLTTTYEIEQILTAKKRIEANVGAQLAMEELVLTFVAIKN